VLPPPRARQRFRPVEKNLGRVSYPQRARPRPSNISNQDPLRHKEVDGPVITSPPQTEDDAPTIPLPVITDKLLQQYTPAMVTIAKAMVTMAEVHPTQPHPPTRAAANHQWLNRG